MQNRKAGNHGAAWKTVFLIFAAAAVVISLKSGALNIDLLNPDKIHRYVLYRVRLPRILRGLAVGAGLAVAGGVLQAVLRNPLADPFIIGTASGAAAFSAAAAAAGAWYLQPAAALAGAVVTVWFVYILGSRGGGDPQKLILAGVIASSFMSSVTLFLMVLNRQNAYGILFFLVGNLQKSTGFEYPYWILWAAGMAVSFFLSDRLDIMSLGDSHAVSLGVNPFTTRRTALASSSLIVAACVSLGGVIGFVGLVVPHIIRMTIGAGHKKLLIYSAVLGAGFLVACDAASRAVIAPQELPVGVITAFTGAPFFLYLLVRKR